MQTDDELLTFADERESPLAAVASHVRKILIVDDDEGCPSGHDLRPARTGNSRPPLQFLHAYSGREAEKLFACEDNIAVILLDVVMESEDAGLAWCSKSAGISG